MPDYHIEYVVTQVRVINVTATNQYDALYQLNKFHEEHQKEEKEEQEEQWNKIEVFKETIIITKVEEE